MQIHQLKRTTKLVKSQRIGRGGKRGTTAGRGTKGQKARAGHKIRPEIRDVIKKLPKLRGYRFKPVSDKALPVNLALIEKVFSAGETVNPAILQEKGLVHAKKGATSKIKILSTGNLTKKLTFSGVEFSTSAKEKIEKAGGSIQ